MINDLQFALNTMLEAAPTKNLARTADDLSKRYRAGHAQDQRVFLHSRDDVIAYAAYRLPATFAAIHAALLEIRARRPDWQPRTLLDVGAGPGTAMWAAATIWPELERITLLERDQHMLAFGKELAQHAQSSAVRWATWQRTDLTQAWECTQRDLVIGAYMLGELPLATHAHFIDQLWSCTADTLLIVEPGTPRGFSLVRGVREQLLASAASTLAPCPHDQACPMPANDWCHFAQRVNRSKLHRTTKGATLSYEDEKFSYAAMARTNGLPISGRVIRHPQKHGGHMRLELCTPEGLKERVVTRSDREAYHDAQDLRWGSALPNSMR
ncbi:MAG TPA: small ribosomal subunit Rsm22 family protein [Ktedonosporobacter sp.]|nr:small ribosomal subunit Rsm22 family protein [Ktedonosporobacter sp.]